ncbi:AtpZ/AtpI family protein [Microbulbifer hydrolyticus]|uniref:ATP synthase protein I n=1 Tax=Microbulbifer hydrolyticus TaxID=48074 RepID=A0A6P1TBS4_9GAMM|nr:AtpZ/AtpI family protein [Microbulbifer hydrolyticus]MBB5210412.1 ATP synthase protein I [Microbulbifer hydrolyticus]QHQ39103.1 F0F1 ATP synthase subunit [Microbulbifer hydrolyticus]
MAKDSEKELRERVSRQARRMKQAEHDRRTLLAQTIYIGTLGLVFVLPVVGGAYLGRWLDGFVAGYSMRWTLSLIFLGVVVGGFNVYLLIRE